MAYKKPDVTQYVLVNLTEHRLDVADLSATERGIYETLRVVYFERKTALPAVREELYRLAGAYDKRERKAVDTVLAKKFAQGVDGLWHNERCDAELARIEVKIEQTRAAGRASAVARRGNERSTDVQRTLSSKEVKEVNKEIGTEEKQFQVPRNTPAPPKEEQPVDKVGAELLDDDIGSGSSLRDLMRREADQRAQQAERRERLRQLTC